MKPQQGVEPTAQAWAIIPARGGSKGVPRKNLVSIGGVPLVVRTVQACFAARSISRTVVSTDDREIANVSIQAGATVVWRPAELASDSASSESAVEHAIASLVLEGSEPPKYSLLVQCTSPFLMASDLDAVVSLLATGDIDSCFTAIRSHRFLWKLDSSGIAVAVNHDPSHRLPRQSLDPEFMETGAAYGFITEGFLQAQNRFFGRTGIIEIDSDHAIEIDDPTDLAVARSLELLLDVDSHSTIRTAFPTSVSALVFDFDGVMTNNQVTVDQEGRESVVANRSDGMGIELLREKTSIRMLVISTETNPVVRQRCAKLGLECLSGVSSKDLVLQKWLGETGIDPTECIFVGNDINDLPAMGIVGFSAAPADAEEPVRRAANLVLSRMGGNGAVRELADLLIDHAGSAGPAT